MSLRFFFLTPLVLFCSACTILAKNKSVKAIEVSYSPEAVVTYNTIIPVKVYALLGNDKTKNITGNSLLKVETEGGTYRNKALYPLAYPLNFNDSLIKATFSFENNDSVLSKTIELPYNYKGDLSLDFSGQPGKDGADGTKGQLNVISRDGVNGGNGEDGMNGENGHELLINIWKTGELYFWRVNDITVDSFYCYKTSEITSSITINASGGKGGIGGDGGKGKNGKDGTSKKDKLKPPGNGGNGGNGGHGGQGGNGGNVYVFVHSNASDIISKINIISNGGQPGQNGEGGAEGKAGIPLDGQKSAERMEPLA